MAAFGGERKKLRKAAREGKVLWRRRVGDADTSMPWTQPGGSCILLCAPISDNKRLRLSPLPLTSVHPSSTCAGWSLNGFSLQAFLGLPQYRHRQHLIG